ncbi:MAG: imidazolonepropionase, partial [Steroidobacteraceae bacterium]
MDRTQFIIDHARLVTLRDERLGLLDDAALLVRDGRIAWVGKSREAPADESIPTIDAAGRCVTPGLIDCHTHLLFAGCRTNEFEMRLRGESYTGIAEHGGGIQSTVRATRAASAEALASAGRARLQHAMASGVTTIEIKSGYGLTLADERKMLAVARQLDRELPIHIHTTFLGAHTVPPEFSGRGDAYVTELIEAWLPQLVREGLVDSVDAFCERIAFTHEQVERLFAAARKMNLPVRLHADQLTDSAGATLAARYSALSADHLEHASANGIAALEQAGTVAVLLPGAYYYLREENRPPVKQLRAANVAMAVATDFNPGTSPLNSLPVAMNLACVLFDLTPNEAWLGVTRHAARALGCLDDRGTLEVQKRADFVMWDVEDPVTVIERMGLGLVNTVWVDGHPINTPTVLSANRPLPCQGSAPFALSTSKGS